MHIKHLQFAHEGVNSGFRQRGFTLAELLVALVILGIIATFLIPKILQSTQDQRNNSIVLEFISSFSQTFADYQRDHIVGPNTKFSDIMGRINYLGIDTTSIRDAPPNWPWPGPHYCNPAIQGHECYRLPNGALVGTNSGIYFGNGSNTGFFFTIDPDGKFGGNNDAIGFCFMQTGKIYSFATCPWGQFTYCEGNGACGGLPPPVAAVSPQSSLDPPYFHWN